MDQNMGQEKNGKERIMTAIIYATWIVGIVVTTIAAFHFFD